VHQPVKAELLLSAGLVSLIFLGLDHLGVHGYRNKEEGETRSFACVLAWVFVPGTEFEKVFFEEIVFPREKMLSS
jgi:hypothetical protein